MTLGVTSQLHDMFDAVQEYRSGEERHWDLDRALLESFKDMTFKIVDGIAAEFYSELSVERSSIHTRRDALGGLDDMLLVAASIQGQHAALGADLARKAFEEATRRMSEPSPSADVMQRVVETVTEVLSLSIQNKSVAERDAIDFVKAAVHWAWTSKDSTVVAVLSDLGDRSHNEAVAQVLRAGAASVALATGRAELAQKHIERVTPNALSEAHFFGYFGKNTPDLPRARILLAEILCRARIGSKCFADALSQLFKLGVREATDGGGKSVRINRGILCRRGITSSAIKDLRPPTTGQKDAVTTTLGVKLALRFARFIESSGISY